MVTIFKEDILFPILTTIGTLITFVMRYTFVTRKQIDHLAKRVSTMENKCMAPPSDEAIHRLKMELSELRGDLKETNAYLRAVTHESQLLLEKVVNRSE